MCANGIKRLVPIVPLLKGHKYTIEILPLLRRRRRLDAEQLFRPGAGDKSLFTCKLTACAGNHLMAEQ